MRTCKACQRSLSEAMFALNKHAVDHSGLSSWCRQCGKDPVVQAEIRKERGRDWASQERPGYLREMIAEEYEKKRDKGTERRTMALLKKLEREEAARTPRTCMACHKIKMKIDFPRVAHDLSGRSLWCTACMLSDPDGKKRLSAERSRARYEMLRQEKPEWLRKEWRQAQAKARYEQKHRATARGVRRDAYERMSPLEQYQAAYGEGVVKGGEESCK